MRIVQILLGTVSVGLVFLTAREWFGERAAWIAAGVAALTGLFTFYEALILQASLDGFLTSAALLCVTRGLMSKRDAWWATAGLVFAAAILNRPNMAFGLAAIAAALLVTRRYRISAVLRRRFDRRQCAGRDPQCRRVEAMVPGVVVPRRAELLHRQW